MPTARLVHEDWTGYADFAALQAAIAAESGFWDSTSTVPGCSFSDGVLSYDPSSASGAPVVLRTASLRYIGIQHWSRVTLNAPDLYTTTEPAEGDLAPLTVQLTTSVHTLSVGLWRRTGSLYSFGATLTDGSETLDATESETEAAADIRTRFDDGPLTWDVFVERWDDGTKVRVRGWLAGEKVLDHIFTPAQSVTRWTAWQLTIDTGTSNAENTVEISVITVWDGDRHPDPYAYGYIWATGFDDYSLTEDTEYGAQFTKFTDSGSKTGANYIAFRPRSNTNAYDFLGKDMPIVATANVPEPEVVQSGHVLFTNMSGATEYQVCSWRRNVAVAPGIVGNNGEHCSIFLVQDSDTTAHLEFRLGDGTVVGDPSPSVTLHPFADWDGEHYDHYQFHVSLHDSDGFLRVKQNRVEWWNLYGIPTATESDPLCLSVTIGHAQAAIVNNPVGSTTANYQAWDDWVITRHPYGVIAVEHLHPGKDDVQAVGVTLNHGAQMTTQDPDAMWEHASAGNTLEPDVDASTVDTDSGADDVGVYPAPLPDYPCIGEIVGLVPTAMFSGLDTGGFPFEPQGRTFLKDANGTAVESFEVEVRYQNEDPPSLPYQGFSGYLHHRPQMWATQLTTGDQWVDTDLDTLVFGVQGSTAIPISVSTLSLMVLCVDNGPAADEVQNFLFPRRNIAWREATQVFAWKNLLPREATAVYEMRNLEWRPVFLLEPADDRLCPDGRQPGVEVTDAMQSETLNHRIWDTMEENFLNPDIGGGIIEATTDGVVFNGPDEVPDGLWLESRAWYRAHGLETQIEVPSIIATSPNQAQGMEWNFGGSGWGIQLRQTTVEFYTFTSGLGYTVSVEGTTSYDAAGTRWFRLAHTNDVGEDRVTGYVSADGGVDTPWVEVGHVDGTGLADDDTVFPPNVQIRVGIWGRWDVESGASIESSGSFKNFSTSPVDHV